MKIYQSTTLAGMPLKNHFIRSATHEGCGDAEGNPDKKLGEIYRKLVDGGVGAIITGYVGVNAQGRTIKNMILFDSDERAEKYRKIIAHAQKTSVPVILQIAHGGGQSNARPEGMDLLAPSPYKFMFSKEKSRAMTEREIEAVIDDFVQAIIRAKKIGFSGVQLHCAHGYLLSQFLSLKFNKRSDQWGGTLTNRFRIISEILSQAKKEVGSFPVLAKISAYSLDKNNVTLDDSNKTAKLLESCGCDGIEVSCGAAIDGFNTCRCKKLPVEAFVKLIKKVRESNFISKTLISIMMPIMVPCPKPIHDYNVDAAYAIKQQVDIPVLVVGGIRKRQTLDQIIENEKADFISLSRPFIIESNLVKRFQEKKQEESRCINCSYCIIGSFEHSLKCYYGKVSGD